MINKAGLIVLGTIALGATAFAGTVSQDFNPADFNDTTTWGQLGPDGTVIPHSFTATSTAGDTITGSFTTTTGLVAVSGSSWTNSNIPAGDTLVWAFENNTSAGTGPITLGFPTGFGAGAVVQADSSGQFEAELSLYDSGNNLLGSVAETSDANGDALFIGAVDNVGEVASAVFSMESDGSGDTGDFAMDTLYLQNPASATPEPSSMLLIGGGLAAFGLLRRRVRR